MKNIFCFLVMGVFLSGCVSTDLQKDHVKKERATYTGMQPFIQRGIEASPDSEKKAGELLNESWDARLKAYETRLANQ